MTPIGQIVGALLAAIARKNPDYKTHWVKTLQQYGQDEMTPEDKLQFESICKELNLGPDNRLAFQDHDMILLACHQGHVVLFCPDCGEGGQVRPDELKAALKGSQGPEQAISELLRVSQQHFKEN